MNSSASLPRLPRRDQFAIIFSLSGVTILCWIYLIQMAQGMSTPGYLSMAAFMIQQGSVGYFWMMFSMWVVMMVGMMLPSVAPMVLIYAAVARKSKKDGMPVASTASFVTGYLIMWVVFSMVATLAQWQLDKAALLSPLMVSSSPIFGAVLLMTAGIYQWLPVREPCLTHCRAPAHFISQHWRPGTFGALRMGFEHGIFCVGCCWFLMALLFVGGVMNVVWIAIITLFVLLEKILPIGDVGGKGMGIIMIAVGLTFAIFR